MPKAIRIQQQGGPEVLKWEDVQAGDPGPGEARVRHKACGLNFLDVYQRSGLYKIPLPSGMGSEGAGVVEAVGAGVTQVKAAIASLTRAALPAPIQRCAPCRPTAWSSCRRVFPSKPRRP